VVSDADERNSVFEAGSFPELLIEQESSLFVEFDIASQSKAYSLKGDSFIRSRGIWCGGRDESLEIFSRIEAKYAVCPKDEVEIAAMLLGIDLVPQFVGNQDSALIVDNVFVFAC